MSKIFDFSKNLFLITFVLSICFLCLAISFDNNSDEDNDRKTCLMDSICKNKDKDGNNKNSPCHQVHLPYDNVTDDDFYELLWNNCPHFFDEKGFCICLSQIILLTITINLLCKFIWLNFCVINKVISYTYIILLGIKFHCNDEITIVR